MSNGDEPFIEGAKAVQEVAKTSGKAIDAAEKFGSFVSTYIAGSLEQGMGIFEDKLKFMRWERQLRMMKRANQLQEEAGLDAPTRPIPLKFAIPLLEGASLEDDDSLQDMWAKLLVNAANKDSGVDLRRAYIDLLAQISPEEASILHLIYSPTLPYDITKRYGVIVGDLPNSVRAGGAPMEPIYAYRDPVAGIPPPRTPELLEPPDHIKLALANLKRLGCISLPETWAGQEVFTQVHITLLGKHFIEACTLKLA
ncbi:Abi-alpha family protein [Acidovorax sp. A1169]|uniref:Abi-alpha family protein n=1 Tax=Acidovorax sp. A1169 TaxID=3059524 RepID=UPI002737E3D1|nr:Abi-alpha family protein [Acidovorax sp. A1169]MDP4075171.1 Abi-alpha family protein [Acidovorax sp. A1169]